MEELFMDYPRFTPEMKKTHKILIPNMAPVQFRILAAVMQEAGYTCELLENCGSQVCELGLKYVHNDTCYPALLVIGQFLDALGSGGEPELLRFGEGFRLPHDGASDA